MSDIALPDGVEWLDPPTRARGEAGVLYGKRFEDWAEICKQRPGAWLRISTKPSGINGNRRKGLGAVGLEMRAVQKRTDGTNGVYIRTASRTATVTPIKPPTTADDPAAQAAALHARAVRNGHTDPVGFVVDNLGVTKAKAKELLGIPAGQR